MLCWERVNSASSDRAHLLALLAAVEEPGRAASLPADDDLVRIARYHRLAPLLSALCADTLPRQLAETFRLDRVVTAGRGALLDQAAEECLGRLGEAGIPTIVLKGLDYERRLYPASGARPTSDVDLLVPSDRRRDAFVVLDRLGFEPRAAAPGFDDADYHEVAWTRQTVEVDLHLGLAPLARCAIDYPSVWDRAQPIQIGRTPALALEPSHAAVFHALHMAIDHFGVPAIYLVDLARWLPTAEARRAAEDVARAWRCWRPLATALSLAAAVLPRWASRQPPPPDGAIAAWIAARYGAPRPLLRGEQLLRKVAHFDALRDALRYLTVQSRRNIREQLERRLRRRTPRERLALARAGDPK
jgi:hypothetical protein